MSLSSKELDLVKQKAAELKKLNYSQEFIEEFVKKAFGELKKKKIEKARTDFKSFVELMFEYTTANIKLENTFHIDVLTTILQLKYEGKLSQNKIIISIPPGHSKTLICNVLYSAWIFGINPSMRLIVASNSQDEVNKRNVEVRELMQNDLYRQIFPDSFLVNEEKTWLTTNKQGGRRAVSTDVAKRFTGGDADFLLIDDPNDTTATTLELEKTNEWFYKKAVRRLRVSDRNLGTFVIMQRVDKNDLAGYILEKEKENTLYLVLKAEEEDSLDIEIKLKDNSILRFNRQKGYLWQPQDDRLRKEINAIYEQAKTDNQVWETQYQQNPIDSESVIIRREWFSYYTEEYTGLHLSHTIITTDYAFTTKSSSDYTVLCVWGVSIDKKIYLLDMIRDKFEYTDSRSATLAFYNKWKFFVLQNKSPVYCKAFYIEDTTPSKPIIDDLKKIGVYLSLIKRSSDKFTRVSVCTPEIRAGLVHLPKNKTFTEDVLKECESFRDNNTHKHDDIVDNLVDCITQELKAKISYDMRAFNRL